MRSFGRVFRRGDSWYIRVRRRGEKDWTRRVAPAVGEDPAKDPGWKLATQKLASIELDLARERHLGIRVIGKVTLKQFLPTVTRLLQSQKKDTVASALSRLRIAAEKLRGPMSEVSPLRAAEFLLWLRDERQAGPNTRNHYRSTLSMAWQAAEERSFAAANPWLETKSARVERTTPPRLTSEDVAAIVARAPEWSRVPLRLLAETGLRRGELLALQWRDVDLVRRVLLVRRSKSGKSREVPLNAMALSLLAGIEAGPVPLRGEHLVFPGLNRDRISRVFGKAARRSGFKGAVLHNLRASFITRALDRGAGVSTVRDLAGHSSIAITDRYVSAASDRAKREAVEGIGPGSRETQGGTGLAASS